MTIKRGDIFYADLSPVVGSEQGGIRPVLIVQNDVGNKFSPVFENGSVVNRSVGVRSEDEILEMLGK